MRSAAVALLLAAVVLAAWWCWGRTGPAPAPGVPARDSADMPPIPPDAVWVEVRVIDWVTGSPVAGADVWWPHAAMWNRVNALPDVERTRYRNDKDLRWRTFGSHARTDDRGIVRVQASGTRTAVLARHAGRVGWEWVRVRDAERGATLEISRELAVVARVIDPAGRPVPGVPVKFEWILSAMGPRETDASGAVRFEYTESYARRDGQGVPRSGDATLRVRVPGLEECAVRFPLSSPPSEIMTLVVPATGALHVNVSHPGREIESASARLWIGAVDDRSARNESWQRGADADGIIRYGVVPLVGAFVVEVEIGDLRLPRTVAGPTREGQLVEATVEVPADAVALVGRILDAAGQPVASEDVRIRSNLPQRMGWQLHTDEHGRFLWHPKAVEADDRELSKFLVWINRGSFDDAIVGNVGRRALQPGINDLGDIRLERWPLVVAGRFRFDPPDSPHAVSLAIERWVEGAEPGSAGSWQAVEEDLYHSQREGRFGVRGRLPPGRLRLRCGAAEPVEFVLGAEDLVVPTASGRR